MTDVTLTIAGHQYRVNCGDGEEPQLQRLAAIVDAKARTAQQMAAGGTDARMLLFTALLLAEDVEGLRTELQRLDPGNPDASDERRRIAALESLADRAERVAARLEDRGGTGRN